MVNSTEDIFFLLMFGVVLGLFFYGGLWWTVQECLKINGQHGKNPALWFLGSQLLRTTIVIAGFYFCSSQDFKRLLICFVGFLAGRILLTRMTRESKSKQQSTASIKDAS